MKEKLTNVFVSTLTGIICILPLIGIVELSRFIPSWIIYLVGFFVVFSIGLFMQGANTNEKDS